MINKVGGIDWNIASFGDDIDPGAISGGWVGGGTICTSWKVFDIQEAQRAASCPMGAPPFPTLVTSPPPSRGAPGVPPNCFSIKMLPRAIFYSNQKSNLVSVRLFPTSFVPAYKQPRRRSKFTNRWHVSVKFVVAEKCFWEWATQNLRQNSKVMWLTCGLVTTQRNNDQ